MQIIVNADDFGCSTRINTAILQAHLQGVLTSASLMVTGYSGDAETRRWLIWLPLRDVLSMLVWCTGILRRNIYWRGEQFALKSDGRMRPGPSSARRPFGERHAW